MQVLHMGVGYFKMTLHVGIAFRARSSFKGIQTNYMGYFEATMHVGNVIKVDYSFNFAIPTLILTSTNWNFGALLQYFHPYLPLLEFWGFIALLAHVLTFTN